MVELRKDLIKKLRELKKNKKLDLNFKLNASNKVFKEKINQIEFKEKLKTFNKRGDRKNVSYKRKDLIKLDSRTTLKKLINSLKETNKSYPVISYGNVNYTLTMRNKRDVLNAINNNVYNQDLDGSDRDFINEIENADYENVNILWMKKPIKKRKNEGEFFKYLHILKDMDFSRYGIFDKLDKNNYNDNCLINALKLDGTLNDNEINEIRRLCVNGMIPVSGLKKISSIINITFEINNLKNYNVKKNRIIKIGKSERVIKLGLIDDHYFINDYETNITSYALKNYESVKDVKDYNKIIKIKNKKYYEKDEKRFISSVELFKLLLENKEKLLKEIELCDEIFSTNLYERFDKNDNLNFNKNNYRLIEYKDKETVNEKYDDIYYFDFETTTDGKIHKPYLVCWKSQNEKVKSSMFESCGLDFLKDIKRKNKNKKVLCLAHNLGYDIKFLLPYLTVISIVNKSSSNIPFVSALFGGVKIDFKDSLAMIPMPLKKFNEVFDIKLTKEVMPYSVYNNENVNKRYIKIKEALKVLDKEDHKQFLNNIEKWGCVKKDDNKLFNHYKYSLKYCEIDVEVLQKGYEKFKIWLFEITKMNINNYITIASISDAYIKKNGCYNECYEFSGMIQSFIMRCICGGRTMTKLNKMYHRKERLNDFDAVSLYPSAMVRMKGFLKGTPKIIKENSLYEDIKNYDGYFIKINITKINKKRNFPLMNRKNKKGVRVFDNDLTGVHYVDKITLEDYIKYQNIEFDIIKGYYFNEGFNNNVIKTISYLFEERQKKKKEENPIENAYKLMMNSCYGKSIIKPHSSETVVKKAVDFKSYMDNNYNRIKYYVPIYEKNEIVKYVFKCIKPINDHFNSCHIGCEILAMSKRIMNEVMNLAEDLDINIYYQDTDSMHIENDKIKLLSNEFKNKYNRELIGKNMGQFHSDFKFKSDIEPVAVESYFLGKKCYIDKVELCNKGEISYDYHIRMKGISSSCIKYMSKTKYENNPMNIYKKLHNEETIEFNLLADPKSFSFKSNRDFTIKSLTEFKRKIKFER